MVSSRAQMTKAPRGGAVTAEAIALAIPFSRGGLQRESLRSGVAAPDEDLEPQH
jgi:hypothetical protein